jgi:multicomponent Na+:H+ antiporter subunit G
MTFLEIIGIVVMWIGVFFCTVGIIGMIRLPDVYSRIHSSGKVSVLGIVGLLIGSAILTPENAPKALALMLFLIGTSPVSSHAIAKAAYLQGNKPLNLIRNDLEAAKEEQTTITPSS